MGIMIAGTWIIYLSFNYYSTFAYLDVLLVSLSKRTLQERSYRDRIGDGTVKTLPCGIGENIGSACATVGGEVRVSKSEGSLILLSLAKTLRVTRCRPTATFSLVRSGGVKLYCRQPLGFFNLYLRFGN